MSLNDFDRSGISELEYRASKGLGRFLLVAGAVALVASLAWLAS